MFKRSIMVAIALAITAGFATSASAAHARSAHKHARGARLQVFAMLHDSPRISYGWSGGVTVHYYPGFGNVGAGAGPGGY